jgi:hypothetical protein
MRLTFETGNTAPEPHDIGDKSSFRELSEHTFGFGWSYPVMLAWKTGPVTMRGTPKEGSDWKVGMTQLLKDYWFHISWGKKPKITKGGAFSPNMRDAMGDPGPWFDDIQYDKKKVPQYVPKQTTKPFLRDGDSDPEGAWFEDAPGWLNLPYQHPEMKESQPFGDFNFGCTFSLYVSAFDSKDRDFQHLKRVCWETSLAGTFNGGLPKGQRLTLTDGGKTVPKSVVEGSFENEKEALLRESGNAHDYLLSLPELMGIPQVMQ